MTAARNAAPTPAPDTPAPLVFDSTPGARLRQAARDGWTMARRNMTHVLRSPEEIGLYFTLPVVFVLVFGFVFGSGMQMPDGGEYREFLLPGVFVMTMVYGVAATGNSIALDVNRGVVDRFRALPMARSALVVGRSIADLMRGALELVLLAGLGLLVGWQWHNGLAAALAALGLILLLRFALTWVGIYLGLASGNPDTVGLLVFPAAFPLTAMSNIFVAPGLMPDWLRVIAEWNPLSATVAAIRELFGNPGLGGGSWATDNPILLAVLWPVLLIAVFAPLAVRQYRKLGG